MRKLILTLLAVLQCFTALAEDVPATVEPTTEPVEVIAFSEADAGYDGVWVPFEDGFQLYLPSGWHSCALTDAQRAAGLFYRAGNGDGAADGGVQMGVAVGYMEAGGLDDVDALAAYLADTGFDDVRRVQLNGIPAALFSSADGFSGAAFFHPTLSGYVMLVYATPVGEAADGILSSISLRGDGSGVVSG